MSLTGRPPDLQPSSIHPDNPSAKAITSTPLPLNFKSALTGPNNTNIQVVVVPTLQLSGKENHDPTSIRQHYRKKTEGKPLTQEKKRGLSLKPSKKSVIVPSTARRELKWELSRNVKNPSFPITIQAIEALFTNNPNLATLATQPAIGNNDECMDKETVSRDISGIPGIIASQQAPILNETSPN
ncbi:unnamed protein product [Linum trigynum]|uniref:Uncharacterized protein n=1 Tax=Linum trigynum TaxID=586398 RepID=A0AAV2FDS7_9ROSI